MGPFSLYRVNYKEVPICRHALACPGSLSSNWGNLEGAPKLSIRALRCAKVPNAGSLFEIVYGRKRWFIALLHNLILKAKSRMNIFFVTRLDVWDKKASSRQRSLASPSLPPSAHVSVRPCAGFCLIFCKGANDELFFTAFIANSRSLCKLNIARQIV